MLIAARYRVRTMTTADIAQVAAIERESFPTSWPQTAYRRELANRLARYIVAVDSALAVSETSSRPRSFLGFLRRPPEPPPTTDRIVGYVGMWLMVDEAHIVAIAVREEYRRQGLGELLLAAAIQLALASGQEDLTPRVGPAHPRAP